MVIDMRRIQVLMTGFCLAAVFTIYGEVVKNTAGSKSATINLYNLLPENLRKVLSRFFVLFCFSYKSIGTPILQVLTGA